MLTKKEFKTHQIFFVGKLRQVRKYKHYLIKNFTNVQIYGPNSKKDTKVKNFDAVFICCQLHINSCLPKVQIIIDLNLCNNRTKLASIFAASSDDNLLVESKINISNKKIVDFSQSIVSSFHSSASFFESLEMKQRRNIRMAMNYLNGNLPCGKLVPNFSIEDQISISILFLMTLKFFQRRTLNFVKQFFKKNFFLNV